MLPFVGIPGYSQRRTPEPGVDVCPTQGKQAHAFSVSAERGIARCRGSRLIGDGLAVHANTPGYVTLAQDLHTVKPLRQALLEKPELHFRDEAEQGR